jgi:uncharacterized membrane protein/predicted RNA-binding Zn-ribbon protein involved in translation (DUF1610 family)
MTREKSHDEVYCQSCGEAIKRKAEICPECGVKNQEKNRNKPNSNPKSRVEVNVGTNGKKSNTKVRATSKSNQAEVIQRSISSGIDSILNTEPNDPSEHSTNISNSWGYGVAASLILWIISFALSDIVSSFSLLALVGWILMPTSIYFDAEYLKSTTTWKPNVPVWVVLSIIPLINIVAGGVYMFRRYNVEKISTPESNSYKGASEDPAVQELKDRYSRGELSDAEFESRLEQIIQTKNQDSEDELMN